MSVVSPDLPITSVSQDRLGVSALVDKIVSLLVERAGGEWRATRLVIGLTGAWGSGKSSILNLVKSQIDSLDNVVTVSFNPWIFQGSDDLIRSFLDELSKQLKKSKSEKLKELASTFQDYGDAIGTIVDLKVPGAGAILKNVISRKSQPSLTDSRDKLIKKLNEANGAIVVLIDELDRVEPSEIKSMTRLMKAVADLPSVSYLVGYDRKRVELALSSSESDGHLYLKKIVQIALPIRPLIDSEVVEILAEGMTNANLDPGLGDPDLSRHLISIISRNIDTPRDINRLLSLYSALSSMMEGEIDLCDLLAYCALATHNPAIRDLLADKIDAFVNDPTEFEYYVQNRSSSSKKPSAVLSIVMDSYTERLLEFMFPVFGGKSDSDRFGRVQSKLNLLAVLYMGNPISSFAKRDFSRTESSYRGQHSRNVQVWNTLRPYWQLIPDGCYVPS